MKSLWKLFTIFLFFFIHKSYSYRKYIFHIDLSNPTFQQNFSSPRSLSKASTDIPFPSQKNPVFLTLNMFLRESFDRSSSFRYQQPRRHVFGQKYTRAYTHTHIWHKIFRLSSRPSSSMSSRGGEGRVIPWYLSPLPPGAWPKSNVVKIEIIRATTFHPVTGFTPPRYLTRTILNVRSR